MNFGKIRLLLITGIVTGSVFLCSFLNSGSESWAVPEGAKELKNPVVMNDKSIKNGRAVFNIYCKSCHGVSGKGDGPVSHVLNGLCADLTTEAVHSQSDGEIYYKISIGRVEMPSFKTIIKEPAERWQLVNYIRSLKSLDQAGSH